MKTLFKIPRKKLTLAFSGGVDSVAAFLFLWRGKHDFDVCHINHGTESCKVAEEFTINFCRKYGVTLHLRNISGERGSRSLEEFWRDERYKHLDQFETVITGHNLDDVVETWLFSCIHGTPKLIPHESGNRLRPFLLSTKKEMKFFVEHCGESWIEDESNKDVIHRRNYIRHVLLPQIEWVNSNIYSTIAKKLVEKYKRETGE